VVSGIDIITEDSTYLIINRCLKSNLRIFKTVESYFASQARLRQHLNEEDLRSLYTVADIVDAMLVFRWGSHSNCIAGRPKNPLQAPPIVIEGEDKFTECGFNTFPDFHAWTRNDGSG
jgi:hypothetical protein